jgi:glycolate oxidase iron-sulfur subunit
VILGVDDDELALCVSCGLCLPHCPTYRVTGDESASPRGRIAAMRAVQAGAPATAEFVSYMDLCVQCRGCEVACPSSVPFGRLMEETRHTLATQLGYQPWWRRLGFRALGHHRLLLVATFLLALAQRVGLVPRRLGLPPLPLRRHPLPDTGADVWLFTGCVMDAWMRPVHAAVVRVMTASGAGVRATPPAAGCCGALAAHAGLVDLARRQAREVVRAVPGEQEVVVDSAGCGAFMKDYGRLLDEPGRVFASRVRDVHEWLAGRTLPSGTPVTRRIAVQDPCHLRHVQRAHQEVRQVLAPFALELAELDDDGLCCGAGGSYAAWHPDMAARIRDRKLAAIAATGAEVVVSANPGCAMHLTAAGLEVRHPVEVIDEALGGGRR